MIKWNNISLTTAADIFIGSATSKQLYRVFSFYSGNISDFKPIYKAWIMNYDKSHLQRVSKSAQQRPPTLISDITKKCF